MLARLRFLRRSLFLLWPTLLSLSRSPTTSRLFLRICLPSSQSARRTVTHEARTTSTHQHREQEREQNTHMNTSNHFHQPQLAVSSIVLPCFLCPHLPRLLSSLIPSPVPIPWPIFPSFHPLSCPIPRLSCRPLILILILLLILCAKLPFYLRVCRRLRQVTHTRIYRSHNNTRIHANTTHTCNSKRSCTQRREARPAMAIRRRRRRTPRESALCLCLCLVALLTVPLTVPLRVAGARTSCSTHMHTPTHMIMNRTHTSRAMQMALP